MGLEQLLYYMDGSAIHGLSHETGAVPWNRSMDDMPWKRPTWILVKDHARIVL